MAITIQSNIASLQAQRQLSAASSDLSRIAGKLSSGLRINRASDDAAGLALSTSLQSQGRLYRQAVRNINDGVSVLSIGEGALKELTNIVIRIEELAEQSANGIYRNSQRIALDREAQSLRDEFHRIVDSAEFNGGRILNGEMGDASVQAGIDSSVSSRLQLDIGDQFSQTAGDGTYGAATTILTGMANPDELYAADLNGDGRADLLSVDWNGVRGLINNGNGTFTNAGLFTTGSQTDELTAADVNNDGFIDAVAPGATAGSGVYVLLGNGNGTFKASVSWTMNGVLQQQVELADLNNDGNIDLVGISSGTYELSIRFGNGNGTFKSVTTSAFERYFTIGDVNNDNNLDLVSVNSGVDLGVRLGNGDGTFKARIASISLGAQADPHLADVNGDYLPDIVFETANSMRFSVAIGNGNGTFAAPATYISSAAIGGREMQISDVNSDGELDVLMLSDNDQAIYVHLGNGNGSFRGPTSYASGTGSISGLAMVDSNGDGALDIVHAQGTNDVLFMLLGGATRSYDLDSFSLTTREGAKTALDKMKSAHQRLTKEMGSIGAMESRLMTALRNNDVSAENIVTAASQIADVDVATATAELARTTILQRASAAVLAAANQQPAIAVRLLQQI